MSTTADQLDNRAPENKEIDLGTTLTVIARGFKKLGDGIAFIFRGLGNAILTLLIFLKRRLFWILAAVALGLAWGAYQSISAGNNYTSKMIAKFNYESAVTLYGTLDNLNGLIRDANHDALAHIFSISREEAASFIKFSAEPIEDALAVSDLYKQQYLDGNRSMAARQDTLWLKILPFNEFKKTLTKYNMPLQQITVLVRRPSVLSKLQNGLINLLCSGSVLQRKKSISNQLQVEEENIIISSLQGLDTLRNVYNQRLRNLPKAGDIGSTNLNLLDRVMNTSSPELQLYEKELLFRDELKKIRQNAMNNQDIIQVYVPFSEYGNRSNSVFRSAISYGAKAFLAAIVLLLLVECYKFVDKRDKEQRLHLSSDQ